MGAEAEAATLVLLTSVNLMLSEGGRGAVSSKMLAGCGSRPLPLRCRRQFLHLHRCQQHTVLTPLEAEVLPLLEKGLEPLHRLRLFLPLPPLLPLLFQKSFSSLFRHLFRLRLFSGPWEGGLEEETLAGKETGAKAVGAALGAGAASGALENRRS